MVGRREGYCRAGLAFGQDIRRCSGAEAYMAVDRRAGNQLVGGPVTASESEDPSQER